MKKIYVYFMLHCLFLFYSFAGVCSKLAGQSGMLSIQSVFFYGGLLFILAVYALVWQQVLKKLPLVIAYANKSVTIVWGMILGEVLFDERVAVKQVFGAAVIIAGILLMVKNDGR